MSMTKFFLVGEDASAGLDIGISDVEDMDALKALIAGQFAIVQPSGVAFQDGDSQLQALEEIKSASSPVGITIDGMSVREVPGPKGAPLIGNYFSIFPDHLGNNERMFQRYGPIFQSTTMGRKVMQTNDPVLALIALQESDFFSKKTSNENHPLYPLRDNVAGVFLSDTDDPSWKLVHKFLPPCLGPKAVRHYAPLMNKTINEAIPVFDQLESDDQSWNVYQYMLKLGAQAIGHLVLDTDFEHFKDVDAYGRIIVAEQKDLNKGDWYANLPFGDPKKLKDIKTFMASIIEQAIQRASSTGNEDLPLEDAALHAANVIDYLVRATDSQGQKLPKENLRAAVQVAGGAGFTTTSTLLSWLIYGLVTYPGMQDRLLQELVDNGFNDDTEVTSELTDKLTFQEKYVKEMQRVHNPSYQPGRVARLDCVLPGGYKIHEVMSSSLRSIISIQMQPGGTIPLDSIQTGGTRYIPFATGQRMCIGFNFALQEVKVFLPKLVWRYKWTKEGETAVEYDPFFQLIRPVNLYVKTERRTQYPSKSDSRQS